MEAKFMAKKLKYDKRKIISRYFDNHRDRKRFSDRHRNKHFRDNFFHRRDRRYSSSSDN